MERLDKNKFSLAEIIVNSNKITDTCKIVEDFIIKEENSIKTGYTLKYLSKLLDEISSNKTIRDKITNDTKKLMDNNEIEILNNKIKFTTIFTSYDYKDCNHLEYNDLCTIENYIKDRKKIIEEYLVNFYNEVNNNKIFETGKLTIKNNYRTIFRDKYYNFNIIDNGANETGETMDIYPPKKIQKEGLKYFIK